VEEVGERRRADAPAPQEEKAMKCITLLCGTLFAIALLVSSPRESWASLMSSAALTRAADALGIDTQVARRGVAVRGGAFVGPRGGVAVRRTTVAGPRRGVAVQRAGIVGPRGAVVRRGAFVAPGGVAVRRAAVVRPGWGGGGVRWVRPAHYRWRPGGAIAAGAAIGFLTAATAAAWAGTAPGPNMCWYYTDPSRTQGFWDVCP
jgi:hypothetical protein